MTLGQSTLMGAVLIISAMLTATYVMRDEGAARAAAGVGTIATFVVGLLLLFSSP